MSLLPVFGDDGAREGATLVAEQPLLDLPSSRGIMSPAPAMRVEFEMTYDDCRGASGHQLRDLIQGPRLADPKIGNDSPSISCGGAGYCPLRRISENLRRDAPLAINPRKSLIEAVPR